LENNIYFANYFNPESIKATKFLGNWFTLVFFVFYVFSTDSKIITVSFKPKKLTYKIALLLTLIISILILIIGFVYLPSLISLDRRGGYDLWKEIGNKYKLILLIKTLLVCLTILVWRTKNFKWYLILLMPIAICLAAKGRSLVFSCILFVYLNYVIISRKSIVLKISIILIILIGTVFFRMTEHPKDWISYVWTYFGDVFYSWLTTIIVYDNFLNYGDLITYLWNSLLSFLPLDSIFFSDRLLDDVNRNYAGYIAKFYKKDFNINSGLAGNIVTESLFYGGLNFTILSPIIIGGFLYSLNQFMIYKKFPGFIFYCLLISNLRGMVRDSFYNNVLEHIGLMFSTLIWLSILENGRVVIIKIKKFGSPRISKEKF
jgi:hypothetical protein